MRELVFANWNRKSLFMYIGLVALSSLTKFFLRYVAIIELIYTLLFTLHGALNFSFRSFGALIYVWHLGHVLRQSFLFVDPCFFIALRDFAIINGMVIPQRCCILDLAHVAGDAVLALFLEERLQILIVSSVVIVYRRIFYWIRALAWALWVTLLLILQVDYFIGPSLRFSWTDL